MISLSELMTIHSFLSLLIILLITASAFSASLE
jgi:hypothetical protein